MNAPTAEEHLGLVHLCANRFRGRGMEYEDLYSAGCIGLLKAVKAFDCTRGVQFSTYAVPVILGEIKRLFRDGGAVKVSRSLKEHAMQIQQLQEQFQQKHGRAATLTELAERSGLSEEIIAESLCAAQPPLSLTTAAEEAPLEIPVPAPDTELENLFALRQVLQILPQADQKLLQILLSGFTDDYSALLIGVNLGGLGTLIASLASLISFKFYTNSNGSDTRRFLGIFTLYNVIFLGVLFVLSLILC